LLLSNKRRDPTQLLMKLNNMLRPLMPLLRISRVMVTSRFLLMPMLVISTKMIF